MVTKDLALRARRVARIVGALLTLGSVTVLAAPSSLADNRAEVTADGLHRAERSVLPLAWKRPGAVQCSP